MSQDCQVVEIPDVDGTGLTLWIIQSTQIMQRGSRFQPYPANLEPCQTAISKFGTSILLHNICKMTSISRFCDFDIEGLNTQKLRYRSCVASISKHGDVKETSISKFSTSTFNFDIKVSQYRRFIDIKECTFDIDISRYRSFELQKQKSLISCSSISKLQRWSFSDFNPVLYCLGCGRLQVEHRLSVK